LILHKYAYAETRQMLFSKKPIPPPEPSNDSQQRRHAIFEETEL
jgi:hypothetical protein